MNRVVSVDKSLLSDGQTSWFVTMEDGTGHHNRVQVDEGAARRFQQVLRSQRSEGGPRLLTETLP